MYNQKIANDLNLALSLPASDRGESTDISTGYNPVNNTWELIVLFSGDIDRIAAEMNLSVTRLLGNYAIVTINENDIDRFTAYPEIEYVEKPRRLFFAVNAGVTASCILPLRSEPFQLTGEGIYVSVIDSGIDFFHPDFIGEDGQTRIEVLWDQTIPGNPPQGYSTGTLFTADEINLALITNDRNLIRSRDLSGHGTHVAGIAAGNGRASAGVNRGVAYRSKLIIVKLGNSENDSFPRTTRLMEAIDFSIKYAAANSTPVAVNLSFGNNYGSHDGYALIESYINMAASYGRTVIVAGTGNEAAMSIHVSGNVEYRQTDEVSLSVSEGELGVNVQLWKSYADEFDIEVTAPNGSKAVIQSNISGAARWILGNTQLSLFYGRPSPYSTSQEIYFEFMPLDTFIDPGLYTFSLFGRQIVTGRYDMWLPGAATLNAVTRFLYPDENITLTIPSTAAKVISVGAYNAANNSMAFFSGRGNTREYNILKPELVAPGVNIVSAAPGGGYAVKSGTSMAAPFVTGSAALLMEWGAKGNDPFMYGDKVKAYLIRGARKLPGFNVWPNNAAGWGALCLRDSLPL